MNIQELIKSGANVSVTVTTADLKEFALSLIKEARELKDGKPEAEEQYLTTRETAKKLNVSGNTLWRWKRSKYLVPVKVGNTPYYKMSDIERLLKGEMKSVTAPGERTLKL